jgi:hypothetical protein
VDLPEDARDHAGHRPPVRSRSRGKKIMDREELEGRVIAARVKKRADLLEEARGKLRRSSFYEIPMFVVCASLLFMYLWYRNTDLGIIGAVFLFVTFSTHIHRRLDAIVDLIEGNE